MKERLTQHILVLLLSLLAIPRLNAQVVVESKLDQAEIRMGEQVVLTTTVSAGKGQAVKFADYATGDTLIQGIEVVRCGSVDTVSLNDGKRLQLKRDYILTSFDSALYTLPPMEVAVDGKTYRSRSRLGLKVNSVPVDTVHIDDFNPPYDVATPPYTWNNSLLWTSLPAWLLAILGFCAAIRLSKKEPVTRKVTVKPPTPPFRKACQDMDEIRKLNMDDDGNDKDFFIRLTEAIRSYLHARFGFNALEKTTAEITEGMAELVSGDNVYKLKELFGTADFVKFAKQHTTTAERKHCMDLATTFLNETKDEAMENPQPIVHVITLDERKQQLIRIGLWITLAVASLSCLLLTAWNIREIHDTYL